MSRVSPLTAADLAEEDRAVLDDRSINLHRVLAHSPKTLSHLRSWGRYILFESELDPRIRELAVLHIGYLSGSEYEYGQHVAVALSVGIREDEIRAVAADSASDDARFSKTERAALCAAREMADNVEVSAETFRRLQETLSTTELVELLSALAYYCAIARLLRSLQPDLDENCEKALESFPLPRRPF
jgi:alkylhydroperoxidase family enzyme